VFSLIYQDALSKYLNILWNNFYWNIWFYTSPSFKKDAWSNSEKISHKILFNKQKNNQKQIYQSWIPYTKIPVSTINEDYVNMSRKIFIDLFKEWLIYEDKKIVYRSNEYQSVIWNDDVQSKTIRGKKYNIRYFIETKNDSIVICTTSPETIFSDVAFLVNPNDKRYKKFVWSNVLIPIINKPIPILTDETVDTMQNNGIVRVNPNHDFLWLELAQKHKLQIDIW
jgi:valyl-tRNA synthetase